MAVREAGRGDDVVGRRGVVALLALPLLVFVALLAIAAAPAQAGKGWAFKEAFGSANKPKFGDDRSFAVDGSGRLLVLDVRQANERQQVTIAATAGQFKLEFNGAVTSVDLNFNATSVQVRDALRALPTVGPPGNTNVNVSGGPGGTAPFNVTFVGPFAGQDVPQLICQPGTVPLSGGAGCSVATTIQAAAPSVSRWNPDGTPAIFSALGTNAIDGRGGLDATPGNAGLSTFFRGQIAIDRSGGITSGNIYVTDNGVSGGVDVFSAAGAFLGRLTHCDEKLLSNAEGVGVDDNGNVYFSGLISGFGAITKYEPMENPPLNGDCIADEEVAGAENLATGAGGSDDYLFVSSAGSGKIGKHDAATATFGTLRYQFGTRFRVAVEPATGHVFTTNGSNIVEHDASGEEKAIEVALLENAGSEVQAIAPAEASDLLYVGRAGTEEVNVYEAVKIPEATVILPENVSGAKATAAGTVNPEGVKVTQCFFEYGPTLSYGATEPCAESVVGSEDETDHSVSAELSGMRANGRTYHYRLVVKGDIGGGKEGIDKSADETLVTAETYTTDPVTGISTEEATLNGTVKPEGVALTDCFFEYGTTIEYGQTAPCVPAAGSIPNDDADHAVSVTVAGLQPSTTYHYRLVAENALKPTLGQVVSADRTFATLGAPGVEAQIASELGETTATLQALVNPFGSETTYFFEWGTDAGYGNLTPVQSAGLGSEPVLVSAEISGLDPAAEHHFRLLATNSFDTTEGPDQPFETLNEHGLPDDRAFELVTPVNKGPAGSVNTGFANQLPFVASAEGDSFIWPLQNGMPETTAGGWLRMKANRVEAEGTGKGWVSTQISSAALVEPPEIDAEGFANPSLLLHASKDLSCGFLETYNPVTPDTSVTSVELGVRNLYLWREGGDGEVSYELVTDRLPLNPGAGTARNYFEIEAAEDCSRIYFKSNYLWIEDASSLYEWEAATGALRDAGLRPGGSVGPGLGPGAGGAVAGGEIDDRGTASWNAVSPDGRRLFFTAKNAAGRPAVFMREDGGEAAGGRVVEISASETLVPTVGARYEAASSDGRAVFFRANQGIDSEGTSAGPTNEPCGPLADETFFAPSPPPEPKPCDLYVYEVESEEVTDLSVDLDPEGAQIQGTLAVDEDGSHAYFAALGQLTPGEGRTYAENTAGQGRANVYLASSGGLTYVTNMRWEQELMPGALMRRPELLHAHTSADGSALLFTAASRQSWYRGGGGRVAYLYDAEAGEVRCVSCRPDGEATSVPSSGRVGIDSDGGRLITLSRQRALSADGSRAFFLSSDALVVGAEEGKPNLYEWEDGQIYFVAVVERGGDAAVIPELTNYLGMSAEAESAFLATNRVLAPHDRDTISDVYAVREGGDIPFSEPLPECQVDESVPLEPNQIYCQGDPIAPPASPDPSSDRFMGPGDESCNALARRAERLGKRAKALRGKARRARRVGSHNAAGRYARRAWHFAEASRRSSKAAKHCKTRAANTSAGGAR